MTTLSDFADLTYELNDTDLFNDVLAIVGEPEAEKLERGVDEASIDKYGRRSFRIDRPLGIDDPGETGILALIEAKLDRCVEAYALLTVTLHGKTADLTEVILGLAISGKYHIHEAISGIDGDYIVESIDLAADAALITAQVGMVQARAGE
jgi:hypothetical protein